MPSELEETRRTLRLSGSIRREAGSLRASTATYESAFYECDPMAIIGINREGGSSESGNTPWSPTVFKGTLNATEKLGDRLSDG